MKKKILIADDDHDLVEVIRARLENFGYDVVCAYEGIRVIEMAHKEKPDLIILDWMMPAGYGDVVLSGLKEKNDTRHIPVIVLTCVDESDLEERVIKMGAVAFLHKPYDARVLIQKIHEALQMKAFEDSIEK